MPSSVKRLHDLLTAANIPVVGVSSLPDGKFRLDYADGATAQHKTQAQSIVASFDGASTPEPDVDAFLDAVADASPNTGVFLIAQRLARLARLGKQKQKYAEHAALPAPQKAILEAAAISANMPLT